MFRFSIKDLMVATALVSLGLGLALWSHDWQWISGRNPLAVTFAMIYFAASASVGGGLLYPLGQGFLGANLGFLAGMAWVGIS